MAATFARAKSLSARPARPANRAKSIKAQASVAQSFQIAAAAVALSAGLMVAPVLASDGVKLNIKNGDTLSSPIHLEFNVSGLSVKPAADGLVEGTGHFHVLVDEKAPAEGDAIPFDDTHKHYGKGQTADDIALPPGKHTLSLVFANANHQSYGPKFSESVVVVVK